MTFRFAVTIYAIRFIGINFSQSYIFLFFLFFIAGAGFSFYSVISPHLITTWSNKETLGKEFGNLMATGDIAKILFSILIVFFVGIFGWRTTSLSIGLITAAIYKNQTTAIIKL